MCLGGLADNSNVYHSFMLELICPIPLLSKPISLLNYTFRVHIYTCDYDQDKRPLTYSHQPEGFSLSFSLPPSKVGRNQSSILLGTNLGAILFNIGPPNL